MIRLVEDTIDSTEIDKLCEWLKTGKQLTKGPVTLELEEKWAKTVGTKYSVYCNSGSSANLLMVYALMRLGRLKNKKIIVPAVSWATTVAPVMQFGLTPILVDADKESLGVDPIHLEELFKKESPAALILVHVLGFPCKMDEIVKLCKQYDVLLLEDSCESIGSQYMGTNTGAFGLMSTFSFYFGHHLSSIEGGFVNTNDQFLYEMLKMLRSHGWDRDLGKDAQDFLRGINKVDDFHALYTFYHPGFNVRATDLQAFIALGQITKYPHICRARFENFRHYDSMINNSYWKIGINYGKLFVSNFAYPVIHPRVKEIVKDLQANDVEVRPLIAGSISKQPFFYKEYGHVECPFAEEIHNNGIYLPNHAKLKKEEIQFVSSIVNKYT